jgi:siderophore synthetase component
MTEISVGDARYQLICQERDGQWLARATGGPHGDPFGIECAGATEEEAAARLTRWLEWQREHTEALEALQQAERAYHRTIAGSAFASATEGPSAIELQKESLQAVEAERVRLDEVRARKPD